jgi:hypothetical protein
MLPRPASEEQSDDEEGDSGREADDEEAADGRNGPTHCRHTG